MKIVWLAHEGNLSGANLCLLEYLQILRSNGIENYLIIPFGGEGLEQKALELGIPVKRIKYYSWTWQPNSPKLRWFIAFRRWLRNTMAIAEISTFIRKVLPDFVATNTITFAVGALAAKRAGKKHIWFVHEFGEEDHGFSIADGFISGAKLMNQLSHKLVFNSLALRNKYQKFVDVQKAFIVNNAVKIPEIFAENFEKGNELKLILLGQVAPSKNHLEALNALAICRKAGLKFSLTIVGKAQDDNYFALLTNFIKSENLEEMIHFTGQVSNPVALLRQHHALLMCSLNEAFGRVTVEALKCGMPVIGANTGGTLEIMEDGINGYLYQAGDADDLAAKISVLASNYQFFDRRLIAKEARNKYNETNTAYQLLNVFY